MVCILLRLRYGDCVYRRMRFQANGCVRCPMSIYVTGIPYSMIHTKLPILALYRAQCTLYTGNICTARNNDQRKQISELALVNQDQKYARRTVTVRTSRITFVTISTLYVRTASYSFYTRYL